MPCIQDMLRDLTGEQAPLHKDISTDLAVASGAAVRAHQLSGKKGLSLPLREMTDVTSFDIGVAAKEIGDPDPDRLVIGRIISKGTDLPCEKSRTFGIESMRSASQAAARLIVAEGSDGQEYTEETDKIQAFSLEGLPPGEDPEEGRIEVTIHVDQSGIISCTAVDLETGRKIEKEIQRKAV